ncbi:hypothetical protein J5N97_008647 [Dioscorea zingiberensis]|uniref:Erythronate-4-phosphate dehydrogenase family protein n=1 Tax=Dioscorea zingiberensis TaxID=325984 RepID=A0A9D5CWP6_9LILI|nr:hypothetical protein J5N97_008647 [Dioscorea zingiberensis]
MMEHCYNSVYEDESMDSGRKIIMHPLYLPKLSPWLDVKVFYVRFSNFKVGASTPKHLTLTHIPLTPDTILEVNGKRSSSYSECVTCLLRKYRVDKRSEEATFVSTNSIRMTGNVRFEVYDKDDILLCGVLELSNANGFVGESKNHSRKWSMKCESTVSYSMSLLKGKPNTSLEMLSPTIEVYVTGCCSGRPIILTKILHVGLRKKHHMKVMLDSIPENRTAELKSEESSEVDLQVSDNPDYKENDMDVDYNSTFLMAEYFEGEDGELPWFNAGVRVGVGLGLGICLSIGIGVSLFVRKYQATSRKFTNWFI